MGDRRKNLEMAADLIKKEIGKIIKSSSLYETEAWGKNDQPAFYNQIHFVESPLTAHEIMKAILDIEKEMGRIRTTKNAARIIDIDILFFNHEVINERNLIIPHAEISRRRFVLMPLQEITPDFMHPVFHQTVSALLQVCQDPLQVKRLES